MKVKHAGLLSMDTEDHVPGRLDNTPPLPAEVRNIPEVAGCMEVESEVDSGSDLGYTLKNLEEIWESDDNSDVLSEVGIYSVLCF